mgnify:CR=1 FL=1
MSMGERLREARNKIGYSQEEVARRIDLDRTTIGKYENDACVPSSTTLARLVEIYCTDANYILYGKTKKVINVSDVPESIVKKIFLD